MPQAPNLGLTGAGGALAFQNELQKMIAERRAQEQLEREYAIKREQEEYNRRTDADERAELSRHRQAIEGYQQGDLEVRRAAANKPKEPSLIRLTRYNPNTKGMETVVVEEDTGRERYTVPTPGEPKDPSTGSGEDAHLARVAKALGKSVQDLTPQEALAAANQYMLQTTRPPQAQIQLVPVMDPTTKTVRYVNEREAAGQEVGRVVGEPRATGEQTKTRDFYTRMRSALDDMDAVEGQLNEKDVAIIQGSPLPEAINNMLLSPAGQRYAQALRAYTLAKLRRESGAAISAGEFQKEGLVAARTTGDTPETLAQKKRTREGVAEGFAASSGQAFEDYYGKPFERGATAGGGKFTVTDPTGKVHAFETQSQADTFKRLMDAAAAKKK